MKILFLDCDGVLNCATTNFKTDLWPLDRYMAFLVGKIILDTGAKVVLSSAWRIHPEARAIVDQCVSPILDITPHSWYDHDTEHHSTRGEEIQKWINDYSACYPTPNDHACCNYKIDRYAILDDCSDMLPDQLPNFFRTSWATGLTEKIANQVIAHLNTPKGWVRSQGI